MSKNKAEIQIFSAWNSYAVSMMSVLEHCGMWRGADTFQKFLCETGIAAQFCADKICSPLPVTDYDWITDHTSFLERIGVQTAKYYAAPGDPMYNEVQQEAVQAIRTAVDNHSAAVAWGIDTGEFGVIYGYDDEDAVFFAKGIGSPTTNASLPVLYRNLGKTFAYAPVLYCEIPRSFHAVDENRAFYGFLESYVQEMQRSSEDPERAYGFAAYDMLLRAASEKTIQAFGLRYCAGIYYERKAAILSYLSERQKEDSNPLLSQFIDSFRETVQLYEKLMYDILQQNTDGWNYVSKPVPEDCLAELAEVFCEMKMSEMKNVAIAKQMLAEYAELTQLNKGV